MQYKYLESRPDRASGELTIKGTRIRIAQVINMLAHGSTLQELHEGWSWISVATLKQGRIILTKNVKDFRPLLRKDSPGIIGIPETWPTSRIDSKLTALLMRHGPNYFRGRYHPLAAEELQTQAA